MTSSSYTIGFANLDEQSSYPVAVRESFESALAGYPELQLILKDNALNDDRAVQNARELAEAQVDLVIMYHINERLSGKVRSALGAIPIIAIDIPIPLTSYVGIDNYEMGILAGEILTEWIEQVWDGQVDKLIALVDSRVLGTVRERVVQAVKLVEQQFPAITGQTLYLDCGNTRSHTSEAVKNILNTWDKDKHVGVISFNDESALGTYDAVNELNWQEQVAIVGHAASQEVLNIISVRDSCIVGTTLSYPELYGETLRDKALDMLNGNRSLKPTYVPLDSLSQLRLLDNESTT